MKYLRRKPSSGLYLFQYRVPTHLQGLDFFAGKTIYVRSLHTTDRRTAQLRRDELLQEIRRLKDRSLSARFRTTLEAVRAEIDQTIKDNPQLTPDEAQDVYRDAVYSNKRTTQLEVDALQTVITDRATPEEYSTTLRDVLKDHLSQLEVTMRANPKTKARGAPQRFQRAVDRYLDHLQVQDVPISSIQRADVTRFWRSMQSHLQGNTIKSHIAALSAIWLTARDLEMVDGDRTNPFAGHRIPVKTKNYLPWEPHQISDLYKMMSEPDRLPFKILSYTGCRVSEVLLLGPDDLVTLQDSSGNDVLCFHVAASGEGKTRSATRYVPVHPALMDDVKGWIGFSYNRSQIDTYSMRFTRLKQKYLGADSSRQYSLHSLRAYVATVLHQHVVDELTIAGLLGHAGGGARTESGRTYVSGSSVTQARKAVNLLPEVI